MKSIPALNNFFPEQIKGNFFRKTKLNLRNLISIKESIFVPGFLKTGEITTDTFVHLDTTFINIMEGTWEAKRRPTIWPTIYHPAILSV